MVSCGEYGKKRFRWNAIVAHTSCSFRTMVSPLHLKILGILWLVYVCIHICFL